MKASKFKIRLFFSCSALLCFPSMAQAFGASPPSQVPGVEIDRFQESSPGVFRGGRPGQTGVEQIHSVLQMKTIVDLEDSSSEISREGKQADGLNINFFSSPMNALHTPSDAQINEILAKISEPANRPVFVHCHQGKDRTGLVMALYRVEQNHWTPQAAYDEMIAIGFSTAFKPLLNYYKKRTGWGAKGVESFSILNPTPLSN